MFFPSFVKYASAPMPTPAPTPAPSAPAPTPNVTPNTTPYTSPSTTPPNSTSPSQNVPYPRFYGQQQNNNGNSDNNNGNNSSNNGNNSVTSASAVVQGTPAFQNISGTVNFTQMQGGVAVEASINGLPQTNSGFFAFHMHDNACGNPGNDSANYFPGTGGHYNPGNQPHPRHAGDFPTLLETDDGSAHLAFITDRFSVADAVERSVVIHMNPDDFRSQPAGDSGSKIACGTIVED